jgi:hypothetical protein
MHLVNATVAQPMEWIHPEQCPRCVTCYPGHYVDLLTTHLDAVARRRTVHAWARPGSNPAFKANAAAERGGGMLFWSGPHGERLLRFHTLLGRLTRPIEGEAAE